MVRKADSFLQPLSSAFGKKADVRSSTFQRTCDFAPLSAIAAPRLLWCEFPATINYDVEHLQCYKRSMEEKIALCWPQEDGPGSRWMDAAEDLGALWRQPAGEGPILGNGNEFYTMARLSYAMAVADRIYGCSYEEHENVACVMGARLAACYRGPTKAVEVQGGIRLMSEAALLDGVNSLCLRVVEFHEMGEDFASVPHKRKILARMEYDIVVRRIWTLGLLWLSAPTEENDAYRENGRSQEKFDLVFFLVSALQEASDLS